MLLIFHTAWAISCCPRCCCRHDCCQAAVKKEAMESSIEEQLRDKEAVQAENAAQQALCLQHEAEVRRSSFQASRCSSS